MPTSNVYAPLSLRITAGISQCISERFVKSGEVVPFEVVEQRDDSIRWEPGGARSRSHDVQALPVAVHAHPAHARGKKGRQRQCQVTTSRTEVYHSDRLFAVAVAGPSELCRKDLHEVLHLKPLPEPAIAAHQRRRTQVPAVPSQELSLL